MVVKLLWTEGEGVMVDNVGAAIRFNTTIRHHESTGSQPDSSSDNHECRWGIGSFYNGTRVQKRFAKIRKWKFLFQNIKWAFLHFSIYFLFIHLNMNCEGHETMAWPLTTDHPHIAWSPLTSIHHPFPHTAHWDRRSGGEFPYLIRCLGHNVRRHQLPGELSPRARPGQLRIKKIIKIWGWCISLPGLTGW